MSEEARAIFERAARAAGRLLRVEVEPPAGPRPRALRLTFDVGVVVLRAADGRLAVEPGGAGDGFLPAHESEPWWALMGQELTRVHPAGDALRLQFRRDDENPRLVRLRAEADRVVVQAEPAPSLH